MKSLQKQSGKLKTGQSFLLNASIEPSEVIILSDNNGSFVVSEDESSEKSLTDELIKNKYKTKKKITTMLKIKNVTPSDLNKIE